MTLRMKAFHNLFDTQYASVGHWQVIKQQRVPRHLVTHSRRLTYQFRTHFHPYAERLVAELITKDIAGLEALDTVTPELAETFFESTYKPVVGSPPASAADFGGLPAAVLARIVDGQGKTLRELLPIKNLDFDYAEGAYAVYNWEIFFHVPFAVAVQLSKAGRFADAQRWFHYIFDPTDSSDEPAPQRFWKVKPFRVDDVEHIEKTLFNLSTGDDPVLQDQTISAISAWRSSPFRPHLVARTRPTAYMYATVMAYLDNLVDWGDSLFRQDTRESINEASQYYVLAAKILGPKPLAVPQKGKLKTQTYASLRNDLDEFGNAVREIEADIPFDLLGTPAPVEGGPQDVALESLGRSLYFGVPRNDKLLGYWDLVADRLFKIRNSLNLQGVFRQLPLFPPPIDPAFLARAIAAGVDVGSIIAGTDTPLAPVRFQVLLQKAVEICQEVKSLGGQLLAAIEKQDNEALALIRAQHESNLLTLTENVRLAQVQEATKNKEGVQRSIDNAFQRYRYYQRLLGAEDSKIKLPDWMALDAKKWNETLQVPDEGQLGLVDVPIDIDNDPVAVAADRKISSYENHELDKLGMSQTALDVAAGLEGAGAVLNMIPQAALDVKPFGVGAGIAIGGLNLSGLVAMTASISRSFAARYGYDASQAGKLGSYARREQEWAFQCNAAAGELNQLFKQLRGAELREMIAQREYQNHLTQIDQARDIEDFLSNEQREIGKHRKTTTEGFYLWMKGEAQRLHKQFFQFAQDVAELAERAFQYELGDPAASFLTTNYLSGKEGLFAGEKLHLDLKRMELAYLERYTRDFEITKHISLRDWFPLALVKLRATGRCEISIPEALFDLDCPGHTFRRIKSVAVSIPCVAGPYASVNCSLLLGPSYVRTKPLPLDGQWYPKNAADPDAERFTQYPVAKASIVTSGSQSDSGMFETNLRDERYLPFEGAGVIGQWTVEMLGQPRQFDYDTIADLVLSFRYVASAGAPVATVTAATQAWLKDNSARLISMRHEFPSEWARFLRTTLTPGQTASLVFELKDEHFAYVTQGVLGSAKQVHIFGVTAAPQTAIELLRNGKSFAATTLADGEGALVAPLQGGRPGTFDPRGQLELRFDSNAFSDLWLVVDWSAS